MIVDYFVKTRGLHCGVFNKTFKLNLSFYLLFVNWLDSF